MYIGLDRYYTSTATIQVAVTARETPRARLQRGKASWSGYTDTVWRSFSRQSRLNEEFRKVSKKKLVFVCNQQILDNNTGVETLER